MDVKAEAPVIQAASGERSFTIPTESVQNLPLSNRSFTALADLAPGVTVPAAAGTRANMSTNFTMDGISTMDTGSNTVLLQMNTESIAEVKLLVSGYQAEYGRSSGLQVMAVTKSGTNRFRGSVYDVERNSDWNANSRTNILNELPKTISKQKDWGYSIGGPIGKRAATTSSFSSIRSSSAAHGGNDQQSFRVPTALERAGDFSQTLDNNGNLYPYIKDPQLTGACSATTQAGCFADGGVLGRIPASRLYQPGLNILKMFRCRRPARLSGETWSSSAQPRTPSRASRGPLRLSAVRVLARQLQIPGQITRRQVVQGTILVGTIFWIHSRSSPRMRSRSTTT